MAAGDDSKPVGDGPAVEEPVALTGRERQLAALAAGRARQAEKEAEIRAARERGELSRYQQYLRGDLAVTDMDDEELAKGQFRDLADGWTGKKVQLFSAKAGADMKRELLKRGQAQLDAAYTDAIDVLVEIAKSTVAEDKDRIKAALAIMERVAGKVPDRIEVGGADAFSDTLQGIIDDSVVEGDVVPGEVVERVEELRNY